MASLCFEANAKVENTFKRGVQVGMLTSKNKKYRYFSQTHPCFVRILLKFHYLAPQAFVFLLVHFL